MGPEDLHLDPLERKFAAGEVRELILALPNDIEGEATCHYLTQTFAAVPQLTARDAYQLAFNSFEASFAPQADKRAWEHRLKEAFDRCYEYDS